MDEWVRVFMWVPKALRPMANKMAEELDFDSGGGKTFATQLSPTGEGPATDFAACSLVRESTIPVIINELLPQVPGARVYQEIEGWTWRTALQDAGLREITTEE